MDKEVGVIVIKSIFFDFGDTLAENNEGYFSFFRRHLEKAEIVCSDESIADSFKTMDGLNHKTVNIDDDSIKSDWMKVYKTVIEYHDNQELNSEELAEKMWASHLSESAYTLYEDTKEALEVLSKKDITLGILSNFDSSLYAKVNYLGINHFFDHVLSSSSVGYAKPHEKSFAAICEITNLNPSEILYIGDNIENDYNGPNAIGMNSLIISREKDSGIEELGNKKISTLLDVVQFLEANS